MKPLDIDYPVVDMGNCPSIQHRIQKITKNASETAMKKSK
jgi:hypothetical protein